MNYWKLVVTPQATASATSSARLLDDDVFALLAADQTARQRAKSRPTKNDGGWTDLALLEFEIS